MSGFEYVSVESPHDLYHTQTLYSSVTAPDDMGHGSGAGAEGFKYPLQEPYTKIHIHNVSCHDTYLRNPYRDPSIDEPFEGLGSRGFASLTVITCGVNLLMSPPLTPASLPHAGADRSRTESRARTAFGRGLRGSGLSVLILLRFHVETWVCYDCRGSAR